MINWAEINSKLPIAKTDEERDKRRELFNQFDPNGNGYLSLAEVDKGVRDVLQIEELFDAKPAIMRAFQAAKNIPSKLRKNTTGQDQVEFYEFRLLLSQLRQYFEQFEMFKRADTNDDLKLTLKEFEQAVPIMEKWGVKITDATTSFNDIDKNGGGSILFDEFVEWATSKNLDLEDDID